ncbi:manganese-dependent inorganic pyrophosphatase [soil metagenome]
MSATLVFGHLNPDTDTTCSAIAYAWFLSQQGAEATPRVLGPLNKETCYVLERFEVGEPELLSDIAQGTNVVIVDTNNPDELPASIAGATILEIVDHHKLVGGLKSSDPITVTMRPVACTATIIFERMQAVGMQPNKQIAGIMLSAILSDTLNFTSPTSTDVDKVVVDELAALAEVDVQELADAQSAAKSDLTGLSHRDILTQDSKVYPYGDVKVRVSILETTKPENALAMLPELLSTANEMRKEEAVQGIFFFIVDIAKSEATLVITGDWERQVAEKAFSTGVIDGLVHLPGMVSRKKQMLPALEVGIAAL